MDLEWASGGPEGFYQEPSFPAQMPFNYNQLEGRFKQLQGKMRSGMLGMLCLHGRYDAEFTEGVPVILTEWMVYMQTFYA